MSALTSACSAIPSKSPDTCMANGSCKFCLAPLTSANTFQAGCVDQTQGACSGLSSPLGSNNALVVSQCGADGSSCIQFSNSSSSCSFAVGCTPSSGPVCYLCNLDCQNSLIQYCATSSTIQKSGGSSNSMQSTSVLLTIVLPACLGVLVIVGAVVGWMLTRKTRQTNLQKNRRKSVISMLSQKAAAFRRQSTFNAHHQSSRQSGVRLSNFPQPPAARQGGSVQRPDSERMRGPEDNAFRSYASIAGDANAQAKAPTAKRYNPEANPNRPMSQLFGKKEGRMSTNTFLSNLRKHTHEGDDEERAIDADIEPVPRIPTLHRQQPPMSTIREGPGPSKASVTEMSMLSSSPRGENVFSDRNAVSVRREPSVVSNSSSSSRSGLVAGAGAPQPSSTFPRQLPGAVVNAQPATRQNSAPAPAYRGGNNVRPINTAAGGSQSPAQSPAQQRRPAPGTSPSSPQIQQSPQQRPLARNPSNGGLRKPVQVAKVVHTARIENASGGPK
ncbi:uncharacterized protein BJ171DRAFT_128721 [Polychytrium aggregatum]|uniref:uncharacterized protein n=1 Tax=Polychytrium aggregatum TaxID=110093 RepID=UPI0022FED9F0|nr:uncharacterized protein BJ171DRAFT_128721 [Polychytrium aggregatum]KAI9204101.1 hypothetical protein BJ171DRAFT_128721 [Polychytrium aggregatum]